MFTIAVKVTGDMKSSGSDASWLPVVCHVAYCDANKHRTIVEESFRWHLGLDVELMKRDYPSLFNAHHNVARAILLYHYFQDQMQYFRDKKWEIIHSRQLPDRQPDTKGDAFSLWIQKKAL